VDPRVKDCVIFNVVAVPAKAHVFELPLGKPGQNAERPKRKQSVA
jgi:hypothetical protein